MSDSLFDMLSGYVGYRQDKDKETSNLAEGFSGLVDAIGKQMSPVVGRFYDTPPELRQKLTEGARERVDAMPIAPYNEEKGGFQGILGTQEIDGQTVSNADRYFAEQALGLAEMVATPDVLADEVIDIGAGLLDNNLGIKATEEQKAKYGAIKDELSGWVDNPYKAIYETGGPLELAGGAGYAGYKGVQVAGQALQNSKLGEGIMAVGEQMPAHKIQQSFGQSQAVEGGIHPDTEIDQAGFYSEAENVVNKLKQETLLIDDAKRFLQKNGIDKEEWKELRLDEMFEHARNYGRTITKDDMRNWISIERPRQDVVALGGVDGKAGWADEVRDNYNWEIDTDMWMQDHTDLKVDEWHYDLDNMRDRYNFYDRGTLEAQLEAIDSDFYNFNDTKFSDEFWNEMVETGYSGSKHKDDLDIALTRMAEEEYLDNPVEYKDVNIGGEDVRVFYNNNTGEYFARPYNALEWRNELIARDGVQPESANEAVVRLQSEFGDSGDGTKWHDHTQPNLDEDTYKEYYITSDMIEKYGGYHHDIHHGDIEDVNFHLRRSIRHQDIGEVYFIEEAQADLHQDARKKVGKVDEKGKQIRVGYKDDEGAERIVREIDSAIEKKDELLKQHEPLNRQSLHLISIEHGKLKKAWDEGNFDWSGIDSRERSAIESVAKELEENRAELLKYKQIIADQNERYDLVSVGNKIPQIEDRLKNLESSHSAQLQATARRNAESNNPEVFGELEGINAKINKLNRDIESNRDIMGRKVANAPLKDDKWIEASLEFAIRDAIDNDIDYVAWTTSDQQVRNWIEDYRELYENTYDKKMVGAGKRIADKYGSETGSMDMWLGPEYGDEPVHYIKINDQMKNEMKGISAFGGTSAPRKPKKKKDNLMDKAIESNKPAKETRPVKTTEKDGVFITEYADTGLLKNLEQKPLVMYKSADADYTEFDPSKQRTAILGKGNYLFSDKADAEKWSGSRMVEVEVPHDIMEKSINWGDGGQSEFVNKAFKDIQKEVDFDLDLSEDGILVYPKLVEELGEKKAQALLIKHGIKGNRHDNELNVFDDESAKVISNQPKGSTIRDRISGRAQQLREESGLLRNMD